MANVPVPPVGTTQGFNHFWHHLEKDFQILQLALGRSMDDAALLVHLVLQKMLTTSPIKKGVLLLVLALCIACVALKNEKYFIK